jgi:hypothetical protein
MLELPPLTPERFEILVVRELRKVGLEVSELHIHRRATLPEPEQGYLLELAGAVSRPPWRRRVLIACRRQDAPIGRVEVESLRDHLKEAGTAAGILFATTTFHRDALQAAQDGALALLRVTDGRTAFDTSGWGTPGHYPAWLPAYCAQAVSRDPMGQPLYRLLEGGQGDAIVQRLQIEGDRAPTPHVEPGGPPRKPSPAG